MLPIIADNIQFVNVIYNESLHEALNKPEIYNSGGFYDPIARYFAVSQGEGYFRVLADLEIYINKAGSADEKIFRSVIKASLFGEVYVYADTIRLYLYDQHLITGYEFLQRSIYSPMPQQQAPQPQQQQFIDNRSVMQRQQPPMGNNRPAVFQQAVPAGSTQGGTRMGGTSGAVSVAPVVVQNQPITQTSQTGEIMNPNHHASIIHGSANAFTFNNDGIPANQKKLGLPAINPASGAYEALSYKTITDMEMADTTNSQIQIYRTLYPDTPILSLLNTGTVVPLHPEVDEEEIITVLTRLKIVDKIEEVVEVLAQLKNVNCDELARFILSFAERVAEQAMLYRYNEVTLDEQMLYLYKSKGLRMSEAFQPYRQTIDNVVLTELRYLFNSPRHTSANYKVSDSTELVTIANVELVSGKPTLILPWIGMFSIIKNRFAMLLPKESTYMDNNSFSNMLDKIFNTLGANTLYIEAIDITSTRFRIFRLGEKKQSPNSYYIELGF